MKQTKTIANYVLEGLLKENANLFINRLATIISDRELEKLVTPRVIEFGLCKDEAREYLLSIHTHAIEIGNITANVVNGEVNISYKYTDVVYCKSQEDANKINVGDYVSNWKYEQNEEYKFKALYIRSSNSSIHPQNLNNYGNAILDTDEIIECGVTETHLPERKPLFDIPD